MIILKTPEEISIMRQGGKILAGILNEVARAVRPGVTTNELNDLAAKLIYEAGAAPAFLGFNNFPAVLCTSVNEEIVHSAPSDRILKEGDIIGLDSGILYPPENCHICPLRQSSSEASPYGSKSCGGTPGFYTDMAVTVPVGKISEKAEKLINVTKKALNIAIAETKANVHLGDISFAIQKYVESEGFSVIRDLVGHGIGQGVHEDPEVPNFGKPNTGLELKEGMVLAFEPMVAMGKYRIKEGEDGFAYETADKSLAAHFEHTVAVTKRGCEILTQ